MSSANSLCDLTLTSPTTASACVITVDDGDGTLDPGNGSVDTGDLVLMRFTDTDYPNVTMNIASFSSGNTQVSFDPLRGTSTSGQVNLSSHVHSLRVTISLLGRVAICNPDGTCRDFVKIKGRAYIDTTSNGTLNPGNVYVVASDAAFCARYYLDGSNNAVKVTPTTTAKSTATGQYKWFNYTCYLGGGWHGNVGIILAGGTAQNDKFCVGDPVSSNAWEQSIIASRRVYRGMIYKYDSNNASGKEEVSDGSGGTLVRYYSQGIADSVEFPASGQHSHDFVVGRMSPTLTAGSNCISQGLMTRSDSNVSGTLGDLFQNNPVDFICLNGGYLDSYDTTKFGNASTCPYDPSDPPSTRHQINGTIRIQAPSNAANDSAMSSVTAYTSDGPGNCLVSSYSHDGTYYNFTYACDVYDWGNGWNGTCRLSTMPPRSAVRQTRSPRPTLPPTTAQAMPSPAAPLALMPYSQVLSLPQARGSWPQRLFQAEVPVRWPPTA